jgi:hypothetical protein
MVTPVDEPTSNASVLWPFAVPAELSTVTPSTVSPVQVLIEKTWTGELRMVIPLMFEFVRPCA